MTLTLHLPGADGSFNLLEYADADLDHTLIEEHDKNMFDEHLGIKSVGEEEEKEEKADEKPGPLPTEEKSGDKPTLKKVEVKTEETDSKPATTSADFQVGDLELNSVDLSFIFRDCNVCL